jgi:hypothetical protein
MNHERQNRRARDFSENDMGFLTKRTVSEVTFMDSLSSSDDIRYVTLKVRSEGAGRFIELDDQTGKCTLTFYHPDDLLRLAETAKQMWAQGDVMAPNDDPIMDQPPFNDSATAIQPLIPNARYGTDELGDE